MDDLWIVMHHYPHYIHMMRFICLVRERMKVRLNFLILEGEITLPKLDIGDGDGDKDHGGGEDGGDGDDGVQTNDSAKPLGVFKNLIPPTSSTVWARQGKVVRKII